MKTLSSGGPRSADLTALLVTEGCVLGSGGCRVCGGAGLGWEGRYGFGLVGG